MMHDAKNQSTTDWDSRQRDEVAMAMNETAMFNIIPSHNTWLIGIMRSVRDTIAKVKILPTVVLELIAEYAVFVTVVVNAIVPLNHWYAPPIDLFRVYPWDNLRVVKTAINVQINRRFKLESLRHTFPLRRSPLLQWQHIRPTFC